MAGGTGGDVPSDAMEAIPTLDPTTPFRARHLRRSRPSVERRARRGADVDRATAAPAANDHLDRHPAGGHRHLRRPQWQAARHRPGLVLGANPLLVLLAFVVFYAGFPLRGKRWALLLQGTGLRIGTKDSTEIIFLSWLVNCVVPAKLGDVYRAYLLKINSTASLSRTFGTVFIERVLDVFAIAVLGLAAGYWSFRDRTADRDPGRLRHRRRGRRRARRRAVHDAQLRTPDHRRAALAAPGARPVRPVRGRRVRGSRRPTAPVARPPDRPDLDDRGAPAVPRRAGPRVRGRRRSACPGRCSWP